MAYFAGIFTLRNTRKLMIPSLLQRLIVQTNKLKGLNPCSSIPRRIRKALKFYLVEKKSTMKILPS